MKALLTLAIIISSLFTLSAQSSEVDTLVHKAVYKGKDLMVKNHFDSKNGYSVKEVILNDKVLRDPTSSGTFSVDLKGAGLSEGDEYTLKLVYYKSSQAPQILSDN